jgi:TRAP-type C4-dicarboxylate transport system permease large subunit
MGADGGGFAGRTFALMFSPTEASGVAEFYAIWITMFLLVNICWDIFTPRTGGFHLSHMSEKVDTLFSATTFASSIYLLLTVFQQEQTVLTGSAKIPLIISAISGALVSIKYLCPYEIPARKKLQIDPDAPDRLPRIRGTG